MNGLNLWEKSDKRKVTNIHDSVNNADTEFAFFSFHINSVGITLASIVCGARPVIAQILQSQDQLLMEGLRIQ